MDALLSLHPDTFCELAWNDQDILQAAAWEDKHSPLRTIHVRERRQVLFEVGELIMTPAEQEGSGRSAQS